MRRPVRLRCRSAGCRSTGPRRARVLRGRGQRSGPRAELLMIRPAHSLLSPRASRWGGQLELPSIRRTTRETGDYRRSEYISACVCVSECVRVATATKQSNKNRLYSKLTYCKKHTARFRQRVSFACMPNYY